MTFEQFVEHIRQEIREEGFMSAMKLAARIVLRAREKELEGLDYERVLSALPCEDIHVVEYTNSQVSDYRVKDLYYYNPHEQDNDAG